MYGVELQKRRKLRLNETHIRAANSRFSGSFRCFTLFSVIFCFSAIYGHFLITDTHRSYLLSLALSLNDVLIAKHSFYPASTRFRITFFHNFGWSQFDGDRTRLIRSLLFGFSCCRVAAAQYTIHSMVNFQHSHLTHSIDEWSMCPKRN